MKNSKQLLRRLYLIGAVVIAAYVVQQFDTATQQGTARNSAALEQGSTSNADENANEVEQAFRNRQSNLFLNADGVVANILADDTRPPRHQRFIVELSSGHSVLIAHNIDLADRIDALSVGEQVRVYGEYEWNEKGGVIHWTHHDPQGRRKGGWIDYAGSRYQ